MEEYEELREEHYAGQEERHYLTFEKAKSNGKKINFVERPPAPAPLKQGITVVTGTYALDDVLDYIDWNPFFQVRFVGGYVSTFMAPLPSCSSLQQAAYGDVSFVLAFGAFGAFTYQVRSVFLFFVFFPLLLGFLCLCVVMVFFCLLYTSDAADE